MSITPKIIIFSVLFSFTFTTSAAGIICSMMMTDNENTQQNSLDVINKSCHSKQDQFTKKSSNDCCQDMSSCGVSISITPELSLSQIQISHLSVPLPSNDQLVFNSFSPPERPPKIIN